jgi:hypothetical protein
LHDAFLAALAHSLREVGIKFKGGGRSNGSCKHIFSHLMHAFVGVDETTLRKLSGIIADLLVDFTYVGASAPGGGGAGDSLFSLVRTLADNTKTLACGKNYRSFRAEDPCKRKNYPVEQRAALVPKQYLSKDRSLDHQVHGTARGTVGPMEAKLLEYGALDGPDAHAVVGLVLGAFGELSASCYSLCASIARVAAARLLSFRKMSPEQALAFSNQKILRFWGLTGQRGWARLILGRLHDLVLSPGDSKALCSTRTRPRTNTKVSSFQTTETVLPMLPASAGATAAKVLVCVFVLFYLINSPLGGAKTSNPRTIQIQLKSMS